MPVNKSPITHLPLHKHVMNAQIVSLIGCGWLGLPMAERLLREGYVVKGSTTTDEKRAVLQQRGIDAYRLQLRPEPIGDLTALLKADVVIINIPPKAGKQGDDFHPEQVRYLTQALRDSPAGHIIYVSSTSVYAELGRTVTEADVTTPAQSAAPALVRAEALVQALAPERAVTVLRCGGLMGYDRIPGKYVAGRTVDSGAAPVNYLHRDDAVEILLTLIRQGVGGVLNAAAPEHPTREAIYRKSCADFGYELPRFAEPTEPVPFKVVSPAKLIQEADYEFIYSNPLNFTYARLNG